MKRYSELTCLYPAFRERLSRGLRACREAGIPLQVFETYRSFARQDYLYAKGRTSAGKRVTNARPGQSVHQYGLAADLVLWIDGKWSWDHLDKYRAAVPIFAEHGLHNLGASMGDWPHYQLLPLNFDVNELIEIYSNSGFAEVWIELDRRGFGHV